MWWCCSVVEEVVEFGGSWAGDGDWGGEDEVGLLCWGVETAIERWWVEIDEEVTISQILVTEFSTNNPINKYQNLKIKLVLAAPELSKK